MLSIKVAVWLHWFPLPLCRLKLSYYIVKERFSSCLHKRDRGVFGLLRSVTWKVIPGWLWSFRITSMTSHDCEVVPLMSQMLASAIFRRLFDRLPVWSSTFDLHDHHQLLQNINSNNIMSEEIVWRQIWYYTFQQHQSKTSRISRRNRKSLGMNRSQRMVLLKCVVPVL